ncbi:UDP-N-acetylmuramoyl-tripeptide--D-alanyl-D-alanine ligase [Bacillus sp. FJAT-29790]|uniref:UDP-N-acetylmuramoyl-tripeptide--D-alanyl-D- alanine ligase n=1 Tax=Bacillus sp. FJAT-29790 TaxID=1895002 RepID=UPI001C2499E1|nr:UDP-N-acetylmuramoyl-tripeptide--D-alanyl-D-alanine ligase [Bacillus sp. FJAT-29790]MBU8879960.1 UDP-N-acetylmuramoyl-tripeptide--D-alanyl-D-alanine ligase [Bacillus sp. FJAT-29790]
MKLLTISEVLTAINGNLTRGDNQLAIHNVCRQLKNLKDHSLYFHMSKKPIEPSIFMGKSHYVIVTEDNRIGRYIDPSSCLIIVENSKKAYLDFIDYYRGLFQIPVIGVTGTCGKTTTKEMIKHILKKDYRVHGTFLSQNGLHLNLQYLMGIDENTEMAVFEMGVAYPGNIRISGKYFKPTIGVITNIGEAHLEGCKTLEKYVQAKGEMLEVLSSNGTLILNEDDENIKKLSLESFKGKMLSFGFNKDADFRASNVKYENHGMQYRLHFSNEIYEVFIPGYGEHNVYNSLSAIASAKIVGIPIEEGIKRLRDFKVMERHVKTYKGLNGSTVIDDTWSCNPSSVNSAIEVLKSISNGKKEVFVLGKMQRLGNQLKEQHEKMGKTMMDYGGVDYLIAVGSSAALTGESAIASGMNPSNVFFANDANELEAILDKINNEDMIILFKMSLGKMDPSYRKVVEKYRL